MAEEKNEQGKKVVIEREYIVPLRREWVKVPLHRRAEKAVKALKEFMVRHMKVYDRDLRKVKVDVYLNNEIRFMGMKRPLGKVKVKAIKYEDGIVEVKLVNLPKHIEFEIARKAKKEAEKAVKGKTSEKTEQKSTEEEKKEAGDKIEEKEKEVASKEATQALEKQQAQEMKHTTVKQAPRIQRKAMKK
jgi:large subunit ribosomal protein L31e